MSGESVKYSLCVITNGKRRRQLRALVRSARAQRKLEVVIAGRPPRRPFGVTRVECPEAADQGRLGALRNAAVAASSRQRIVVVDDDLVFLRGFFDALDELPQGFGAASCRILNPDGSRYWDWSTWGGPSGHGLKPYREPGDEYTYLCGAFCMLERHVAGKVRWNEELGFYEAEDVDFSRRLTAAGILPVMCQRAVAVHDDPRYIERKGVVMRLEGKRTPRDRLHLWLRRRWIRLAHRFRPLGGS